LSRRFTTFQTDFNLSPMDVAPPSTVRHGWAFPALVALLAFAAIVSAIDPAGSYPGMPEGPGLTTDEMFNAEQGVRLVQTLPELIIGRLTLSESFGDASDSPLPHFADKQRGSMGIGHHNPDHPPLGRFCLGLAHNFTRALFPPQNQPPQFVSTACARTGAAFAFAALVFFVGWFSTRWYGRTAGTAAAIALVFMPRLFGHAHLAALETFINLTYCATVFGIAHWWTGDTAPKWKMACFTGILFGLALLTKIQAILLPLPIVLWAVWHWRMRSLLPLAVWSLTGLAVFIIGWPWLWLSPVDHLVEYFGRTTGRITLYVFYFGERFADVNVPWHYPAVMFSVSVPFGLQLLGVAGLPRGWRCLKTQPREQLLLACMVFPLILFSLPGVAVYDGVRLFLVVFPLWAVFIGRGASIFLDWLRLKLSSKTAVATCTILFALQGCGLWAMHPCYLGYYNLLVGGLRGAEALGMETNYWGDGLTRELLQQTTDAVPDGSTVTFFPMPHEFVIDDLQRQSPILREHRIKLRPWYDSDKTHPRYVLLYRRRADSPGISLFDSPPASARRIAVVKRCGVPLAALFEFPE
jgi:hypothetical protein